MEQADTTRKSAADRHQMPWRLLAFGLLTVASVYIGFLAFAPAKAGHLVEQGGYYAIALTTAWALGMALRHARGWWRDRPAMTRGQAGGLLALIAGLTVVAVMTVPYFYKVLYDEHVLQETAAFMHESREVGTSVRGFEVNGVFSTFQSYLDKRPVFFAFVVSLLHDLTGYREANAFALNTLLMPVLLALTYVLARRVSGHMASLAAVVGLGAFSLLAHNATGAGMELLNLAMLLVVMLLSCRYLDAPSEQRLGMLVLATVLLVQTRYESGLYAAPVAVVVLAGWWRAGRMILPVAAILAPVLLIPYALHNTYLSGTPILWELREGDTGRFGLSYLAGNLQHAADFLFSYSGVLMNSWWLSLAGIPALVVAGIWAGRTLWRRQTLSASWIALSVFGLSITANLGLLMFYYWGHLDDPIVGRLSLPFCTLLALAVAWACDRVRPAWRDAAARLAIAGALLAYVSSGLRANATNWAQNLNGAEIAWEVAQVQARTPGTRLIITNKSSLIWLVNRIAAVQTVRAGLRSDGMRFHLAHHSFSEVLVMQKFRPSDASGRYQLVAEDRLPDNFVLEPLIERRFGTSLARISRLVEVTLPVPPASDWDRLVPDSLRTKVEPIGNI